MTDKALSSFIGQAFSFAAPKMSKQETLFLKGAHALRSGFLLYRKVRYINSKKTAVSFAMGAIVGKHPTVQQIARSIFGSLSIIKCTKDLHSLKRLHRRCRRILAGSHYVKIKGNRFDLKRKGGISPSVIDRLRWKKNLKSARAKAFFQTVGEIFKTLGELTWHLCDVYAACNDKRSGSLFIHSRQLWDELNAPDNIFLLKKLKKSCTLNDWMFQKKGLAITTKLLIGILQVPSKVTPLKKGVRDKIKGIAEEVEETLQDIKIKWNGWQGIDQDYLIEEPVIPTNINRFIIPPCRK